MELVSPILDADNLRWCSDLEMIFEILNENYHILLTKGCSMHVHVAPKPKTGELIQALNGQKSDCVIS